MSSLWTDLRFAVRLLRRRPGFTATALLSLVLGIGTNTALFSLLASLWLNPLPVDDMSRLVALNQIWEQADGSFQGNSHVAFHNFRDLQEVDAFDSVAAQFYYALSLTSGGTPQRLSGSLASASLFDLLGLEPAQGRFYTAEEDRLPEGLPLAVLSHGAWQRVFGGEPDVVGSNIELNGQVHTVVGVAPEGFQGVNLTQAVDVWIPLTRFQVVTPYGDLFELRDTSLLSTMAQLDEGVPLAEARAAAEGLGAAISEQYMEPGEGMSFKVTPYREALIPEQFRDQWLGLARSVTLGAVLILLIACLNVATLLLVTGLDRYREMAVRQAVGATPKRVGWQLVVEGVVLFLVAAVLSLPVALASQVLFWRYRPPQFDERVLELGLQPMALVFAFGLALVTGVLFSLGPAWRTSRVDLTRSLKEGAHQAPRALLGLRFHPRNLPVVAQVALALAALVGAALCEQSLANLHDVDLGFEAERLAVLRVSPDEQGMPQDRWRSFYQRIRERLEAVPGVEGVGLSENRLLRGAVMRQQAFLPGVSDPLVSPYGDFHRINVVAPGFFEAVGMPLVHGRDFSNADREDTRPVMVINQYMAEQVFPGENPVGRHLALDYADQPRVEIIGVARDARYRNIREDPQFFLYVPLGQRLVSAMNAHVRVKGDPTAILDDLRGALLEVEPHLVLADLNSMQFFVDEALWTERLAVLTLAGFGFLALLLAVIGVYGVASYSASRLRRDLGIRRALGGGAGAILRRVLMEAVALVAAGVVVGWLVAFFVVRPALASQLVDVDTSAPTVYLVQAVLLALVALLACMVPAWRSLQVRPGVVLRDE